MCTAITKLTCPVTKLVQRKQKFTPVISGRIIFGLYTFDALSHRRTWTQTLPDDRRICVQEEQILAALCRRWRTAGSHPSGLHSWPRSGYPLPHPVEYVIFQMDLLSLNVPLTVTVMTPPLKVLPALAGLSVGWEWIWRIRSSLQCEQSSHWLHLPGVSLQREKNN